MRVVTHESDALRSNIAQPEAGPHEQESEELPRGVEDPLAEQGHERRADGVQEHEDDGHDDAVAADQRARVGEAALADAPVVVVELRHPDERVRVAAHGALRQVEPPLVVRVVVPDPRVRVVAVDGVARLPRREVVHRLARQAYGAARPRAAVAAPHVGDHDVVDHAAAVLQLDLRHGVVPRRDVSGACPRRYRHVARAVLIDDEDVRVRHPLPRAEANP